MGLQTELKSEQLGNSMRANLQQKQEDGGRRLVNLYEKALKNIAKLYDESDYHTIMGYWRDSREDAERVGDSIQFFHELMADDLLFRTLWAVAPPTIELPKLHDILLRFGQVTAWKKFVTTVGSEGYSSVVFKVGGKKKLNPWILTNITNGKSVKGFAKVIIPAGGQSPDVIVMPLRKYVEEQIYE